MPSINDDEALARALQEEYRRDFQARQRQQREHPRPPPTAPSEEFRTIPSATTAQRPPPPPAPLVSDQELARRLEQEMKDEELARRLQQEQSSSRPRPSSSTRMSSRNRSATYSAGAPVVTGQAVTSPPRSSRRSSSRPSSSRRSSLNAPSSSRRESARDSRVNSNRDRRSTSSSRRHESDWTRTYHSSTSSPSTSDVSGRTNPRNGSQSRSRDSSRHRNATSTRSAHSSSSRSQSSRGRGSSIGPVVVAPDYSLQPSSVDPPLVNATIMDTASTIPSTSSSRPTTTMEQYPDADVELAMRLAQEERDAALAQQLERSDQEIASRNATRLASTTTSGGRRPWTCRRAMGVIIPMVLVIAAAAVIVIMVAGRGDLSNIPNIFDDDPFAGTTPDDASRWKNRGDGLQLEVVNALQEPWWDHFNVAMDEWDAGTPDALMLSRSSADYDYDCSPIQGKMKVCNGDYGNTRWKGINQILLSGGWIISSVAKLNDFYLAEASQAQRQYTTCHEIGHGFGLPHTDEDFYNKDLGNCMDYTNNPHVNKSPDESNYEFLFELYGEAPSRRREMNVLQANNGSNVLTGDVLELYKNAVHKMAYEDTQHGLVWHLLHKNQHFEEYSTDLGMHNGQNLTVQVHMFLADNDG